MCSCISSILEAFLVCECWGGSGEKRGEENLHWGLCLVAGGGKDPSKTSRFPFPVLLTSAPGEQTSEVGSGEPSRPLFSFSSPPPRAFSRRSLAECVPWNLGPLLPLQLMLLCFMLNEARTFTQVTFIIPLSRTLSCAPRAVSAGQEELEQLCWLGVGRMGFLTPVLPWTVSLGKSWNFCGWQLPLTHSVDNLSLTLPGRPCSKGWKCRNMRARSQTSGSFHLLGKADSDHANEANP